MDKKKLVSLFCPVLVTEKLIPGGNEPACSSKKTKTLEISRKLLKVLRHIW